MGDRIMICTGCAGGESLAAAVAREIPVERIACMNVCSAPVSVAARAEGKAAYLFTGVDPDRPQDIVAFARLFAAAPDGEIADARPAGELRFCLAGRIPA